MTSSIPTDDDTDSPESTPTPAEAPPRRQLGQEVEVHVDLGGAVDTFRVHITNPDRIAYEKVQNKRGWPKANDAQNIAMTFVCWSAAKRAQLTALTYEQWEQQLLDWDLVEDVPADPIRPTA